MNHNTTFSIEKDVNPTTGNPFGSKYAGTFSIRRPSLQDKTEIALRCAANMAAAGGTGVNLISDELLETNFIFAELGVIKTADLPTWFDKNKTFEEDEPAIKAVAKAVNDFKDSFRCQNNSGSGKPAGQNVTVVVSPEV